MMFYASCRGLQIFFSVQSLKTSEAEIIVVKNNRENCHTIRVKFNRNKGELDNSSLIKKQKPIVTIWQINYTQKPFFYLQNQCKVLRFVYFPSFSKETNATQRIAPT